MFYFFVETRKTKPNAQSPRITKTFRCFVDKLKLTISPKSERLEVFGRGFLRKLVHTLENENQIQRTLQFDGNMVVLLNKSLVLWLRHESPLYCKSSTKNIIKIMRILSFPVRVLQLSTPFEFYLIQLLY